MRRGKRRWKLLLILFLALGIWAFIGLRSRLWPVVRSLARTQVTNSTSDLINDAIAQQIAEGNIDYERIVYFEKDTAGRITALKTNIGQINQLKTDTLNLINDQILSNEHSQMGIPLGSLFLPEFFSGKGPEIPVKILSIRNSDAKFESSFAHAGINQTMHQLRLCVLIDVSVLVLGQATEFTVSSQVVVAETIIVGAVPDTFFQTGGNYGDQTKN